MAKLVGREARRDRTWRAARRQQLIRWRVVRGEGSRDKWGHKGVHYWAKRAALGCRCTGRHPGRPKTGTGCCMGGPRPAWVERVRNHRECRAWMKAMWEGVGADDLEG